MKTTVNIPDPLMREVKEHAARHGSTVTELVTEGLRAVLDGRTTASVDPPVSLPVSSRGGGPRIDLTDRDEAWDHAT